MRHIHKAAFVGRAAVRAVRVRVRRFVRREVNEGPRGAATVTESSGVGLRTDALIVASAGD